LVEGLITDQIYYLRKLKTIKQSDNWLFYRPSDISVSQMELLE